MTFVNEASVRYVFALLTITHHSPASQARVHPYMCSALFHRCVFIQPFTIAASESLTDVSQYSSTMITFLPFPLRSSTYGLEKLAAAPGSTPGVDLGYSGICSMCCCSLINFISRYSFVPSVRTILTYDALLSDSPKAWLLFVTGISIVGRMCVLGEYIYFVLISFSPQ
jgi:hypothetical protein